MTLVFFTTKTVGKVQVVSLRRWSLSKGGVGKCVFALTLRYISERRQDRAIVTVVKVTENDTIR